MKLLIIKKKTWQEKYWNRLQVSFHGLSRNWSKPWLMEVQETSFASWCFARPGNYSILYIFLLLAYVCSSKILGFESKNANFHFHAVLP